MIGLLRRLDAASEVLGLFPLFIAATAASAAAIERAIEFPLLLLVLLLVLLFASVELLNGTELAAIRSKQLRQSV